MCEISALQLKIRQSAETLLSRCAENHITVGTAESCTGGLIAASVTDIPGASSVFLGGIVSYDNRVNHEVLGVKEETLCEFGAVSSETAEEMALGAVRVLGTSLAVSVTGIAGPGGGTPEKPVGTVWLAVASKDGQFVCRHEQFRGSRDEIRAQTVASALDLLLFAVESIRNPQSFSIE